MLCEKCSQEIEKTVTCGRCGTSIVELGPFCYDCGHELQKKADTTEGTDGSSREDSPDAIDFSNRILCSDGACIGVVSEQGICKVCGKPYVPES